MTKISFNPVFGMRMASPMVPDMFRAMSEGTVWKFNPWTGEPRKQDEILADPFGHNMAAPTQISMSQIEAEINRLASEARIGMQTLHQHTINLMAVGMAKKIDDLIGAGLTRVLGEWSIDTIAKENLACTRSPDGTSLYEVRGIPFLLIRESKLMPDARSSILTIAFDYRFLVDEKGQPKASLPADEPEEQSL